MSERKTKPRSRAQINAEGVLLLPRHLGRIKTLRAAIEKATSRGQTDRIASLQAELDRRLQSLQDIKAELEGLDA